MKFDQDKIVNHLKTYGFVFPNSEIYNGLANAWDFGPLGAISSHQLKNFWMQKFIYSEPNMFFIDSNIIYNTDVWNASGHIKNFSDPLIDCKNCYHRFRADKLVNEFDSKQNINEKTTLTEIDNLITKLKIKCPNCKENNWTNSRQFNLMFKTFQGVVENQNNMLFLRPETAQGIFINFKNVLRTMRCKIPFGIGQIGKAFRNEISPGNFIYRTREFEQMEIEWFTKEKNVLQEFDVFKKKILNFLIEDLQIKKENIRIHEQEKDELAHYARKTIDFEFDFPHGWGELCGLSYRADYDLISHNKKSCVLQDYTDLITGEKFVPHVIEPSIGVNRLLYAIWCNSYDEELLEDNTTRTVMHIPSKISPYQVAVLPLVNKLNDKALEIFNLLLKNNELRVNIDFSGSIGRKYRRQDAIGTYLCVTVDYEINSDNPTVTIRNRDTMQQIRSPVNNLIDKIKEMI